MIEKRSKLGESQTLQQFSRDVDEIEAWISEKLQTATDESYKDPTNIQVMSHFRHQSKNRSYQHFCRHAKVLKMNIPLKSNLVNLLIP